jgi:hypothetical protein
LAINEFLGKLLQGAEVGASACVEVEKQVLQGFDCFDVFFDDWGQGGLGYVFLCRWKGLQQVVVV